MKTTQLLLASTCSIFLAASSPQILAQATTTGSTTGAGTSGAAGAAGKGLAAADKKFVKDAGEGLYYVIGLAEKAKTKAGTDGVKKLSEKLNAELNKVWAELATFSQATNEKLPTELSGGDKSKSERLGKQEGEKFDKEFLDLTSKELKKVARVFETASKSQNPEVKKLGDTWAAPLKNHVTEIEQAEKDASKAK